MNEAQEEFAVLQDALDTAVRALSALKRLQGRWNTAEDNGEVSNLDGLLTEALSEASHLESYVDEWEEDTEEYECE